MLVLIVLIVVLLLLLLQGRVNYVDWSPGGWHPKTFTAKDITPALVPRMRGGGVAAQFQQPGAALPGQLTAAPAVDAETAAAAAVAEAVGATLAKAEAEVAAARAAAATAAAALQLQESAEADDDRMEPACDVAAAMYSAAGIFVQPQGGAAAAASDAASAGAAAAAAAAAAAKSLGSVVSDVQYHLRVQMSWLRKKGRQLDSEHSSSSSSSMGIEAGAEAGASMQQVRDDNDDGYDLWRDGASRWIVDAGYMPLASHCPLFARKFTAGVVNETLAMALSCAGLGLGSWCSEQQWLTGTG
jgi:hypothetical protein